MNQKAKKDEFLGIYNSHSYNKPEKLETDLKDAAV